MAYQLSISDKYWQQNVSTADSQYFSAVTSRMITDKLKLLRVGVPTTISKHVINMSRRHLCYAVSDNMEQAESVTKGEGMDAREIIQKGNSLKAKVVVSNYMVPFTSRTTQELVINNAAVFQLRVVTALITNVYNNLLFVRFTKRRVTDDLIYMIQFTSAELNIVDKTFTSDDGTWHLIHENKKHQFSFDVAVEMQLMTSASSFASLHGDTELTDFELRGEDGSVRVHRAVLAAASPVLRRMLGGAWRETAEGHVEVSGTSQATLEHLKDYMYLQTLPEAGLEQLLLLSSYYMMPELGRRCVERLVRGASAQNACELIEFAAKHNVKSLLLAVLECVQNGAISISEMRNHLAESK